MNKKFSILVALIFACLVAHGQEEPLSSGGGWESDPLDVLEPQQPEILPPTVPEFTEIPPSGTIDTSTPSEFTDVNPTKTVNEDEPDLSREAEFHRDFLKREKAKKKQTAAPVKSQVVNGVPLPPPSRKTPVLKTLPGSLPQYKMGVVVDEKVSVQIELPKTRFPKVLENLEYYISDSPAYGSGVVTATELDLKTAGDYQYIYVRLDNFSSKEFTVQKNVGTVADPIVKGRKGYMIEIQGEIEVLEPVNRGKNIYRAIVKKTLQPIEVGSIVVAGKLPMIDPNAGQVSGSATAKIMGGQFEPNRKLFGSNSLVFLDAGANQGLREGQTLGVYADERIRSNKSNAIENNRMIGAVKIVNVSSNFATGYVTKATDDILVGDPVGASSVQAFRQSGEIPSHGDFEKEFDEVAPAGKSSPDSGNDEFDLEL